MVTRRQFTQALSVLPFTPSIGSPSVSTLLLRESRAYVCDTYKFPEVPSLLGQERWATYHLENRTDSLDFLQSLGLGLRPLKPITALFDNRGHAFIKWYSEDELSVTPVASSVEHCKVLLEHVDVYEGSPTPSQLLQLAKVDAALPEAAQIYSVGFRKGTWKIGWKLGEHYPSDYHTTGCPGSDDPAFLLGLKTRPGFYDLSRMIHVPELRVHWFYESNPVQEK